METIKTLVGNQYIGKSKLDVYLDMTLPYFNTTKLRSILVDPRTEIKKLGIPIYMGSYMPDWVIPCYIKDTSQIGINIDTNKDNFLDKNPHLLYITGIPNSDLYVDKYAIIGRIWNSFYQDSYRGYLFQIAKVCDPLRVEGNANSLIDMVEFMREIEYNIQNRKR